MFRPIPRLTQAQKRRRNALVASGTPMAQANILVRTQNRRPMRGNQLPRRNINIPNILNSQRSGVIFNPRTRRSRNPRTRSQPGTQRVSMTEWWFDVKTGVNKYDFLPGKSGLPQLDRFATIHEQYKIIRMRIQYRPSAGTSVPGNIAAGLDYQPQNDRCVKDIKLLNPNFSGTVFTTHSLNVPVSKAMKGLLWLPTDAAQSTDQNRVAFALYTDVNSEQSPIGQVWASYVVEFSDPTSSCGNPSAELGTPVTICTSETIDTSLVSPPSVTQVSSSAAVPSITIKKGTHVRKIETEQVTHLTEFNIPVDYPLKKEFTVGSLNSEGDEGPPAVGFQYDNGDPVPPGTIEIVQQTPKLYSPDGQPLHGFFATIFSVLKPLIRPVSMFLLDTFLPEKYLFHGNVFMSAPTNPLQDTPDTNSVFVLEANEGVIDVPISDIRPLSYRVGASSQIAGILSYSNNEPPLLRELLGVYPFHENSTWINKFRMEGTRPNQNIAFQIGIGSAQKSYGFQLGDYLILDFVANWLEDGLSPRIEPPWGVNTLDYPDEGLASLFTYMQTESTVSFAAEGSSPAGFYKNGLNLVHMENRRTGPGVYGTGFSMIISIAPDPSGKDHDFVNSIDLRFNHEVLPDAPRKQDDTVTIPSGPTDPPRGTYASISVTCAVSIFPSAPDSPLEPSLSSKFQALSLQ